MKQCLYRTDKAGDTVLERETMRVRWQALETSGYAAKKREQKERLEKLERLALIRRIAEERV